MDNNGKKYFRFYTEYKEVFNLLSKRQQVILLHCLIDYVAKGLLPTKTRINKKTMELFCKIKPIIDGDNEYEKIKKERIKAGKKGAIHRWNNSQNGKK